VVIHDVRVTPLARIDDARGPIWRMLRNDDPQFTRFGEIYFTGINPGVVKAWRRHTKMTMNCAVPIGRALFVLYDDRVSSPTRGAVMEIVTGSEAYALVTVPPGIWNGFKGLGDTMALIANCADLPHDPSELERCEPGDAHIPYDFFRGGRPTRVVTR